MRKTLIIGATSAIAQATAKLFAESGDTLYLVGRDQSKLKIIADDLSVRGATNVFTEMLDVLDFDRHKVVIDSAIEKLDGIDLVLIAHGTLPDQKACEQSFEFTRKEIEINAMSVVSLLTKLANYFEQKKSGTIAVISSVAGDRGRQSNYVYGSAKGMVSVFLQGLRNRLYKSGVNVLTIKPGFVDTPMTIAFKKGILWSSPKKIAFGIFVAINKKRSIVYLPIYWRIIMSVINMIPEKLFRQLKL